MKKEIITEIISYIFLLGVILLIFMGLSGLSMYALNNKWSENSLICLVALILLLTVEASYLCFSRADIIRKTYTSCWRYLGVILFLITSQCIIFGSLYITKDLNSNHLVFIFIFCSLVPAVFHCFCGDWILERIKKLAELAEKAW